jgi:AAA domain
MTATVPQEILTIDDLLGLLPPDQSVPYQNDLFYGDPGAGKTHLLGTVADHPELNPMLLADIDGGSMTLRNAPKGSVKVKQVRSITDLEDIHKQLLLNNHHKDCAHTDDSSQDCDCGGLYKSFGMDSVTELQKIDMKFVMNEQFLKKPDTTDKLVPSQREWGKSNERVRMVIRAFRDLPMHFFATALLSQVTDERTGSVKFYPSLPGKLRGEIPGFFDIVGFLRVVEETENDKKKLTRLLQVVASDKVTAKDRTSSLGDLIQNPSLASMWNTIIATNEHK